MATLGPEQQLKGLQDLRTLLLTVLEAEILTAEHWQGDVPGYRWKEEGQVCPGASFKNGTNTDGEGPTLTT